MIKLFYLAQPFFFIALFLVPIANADEKASSDAPTLSSQQGGVKQNAITTAFGKMGVKRCLNRIEQVTDSLIAGTKSAVTFFTPTGLQDKDSSFLSVSMEVVSGGLTYASAGFHPRMQSDCGGDYETVTYWQESCDIVASGQYANLKPLGAMLDQVQMLQGVGSIKVFLMPAGQGCIAIKKQVIF